jgi:6-phosphogluconolactonase
MPELLATDDIAGTALQVFREVSPKLISLAGGRTPAGLYERMAADGYTWSEVELFMGDERCVDPAHPDSNEGMVRRSLLATVAPAAFHGLSEHGCNAELADRHIRAVLRGRRLDLAILGLGPDGHTASLFPGDPALEERDRLVARVERPDHPRLTLTLPVLSGARVALFLVAGGDKREALHGLLQGGDVPAARVGAERIVAVADREAAEIS